MGATARRPDSVCNVSREKWTYGRAVFRDNRRAQGGAYVCYKLSQCSLRAHRGLTAVPPVREACLECNRTFQTFLVRPYTHSAFGRQCRRQTAKSLQRRRHKAGQFKTQPTTRSLTTHALPWLVILHLGHLHLTVTQTGEFDIPSPSDF